MVGRNTGYILADLDYFEEKGHEPLVSNVLRVNLLENEQQALSNLDLPAEASFQWADEPVPLEQLTSVFKFLMVESADQTRSDIIQAKAAVAAAIHRFVDKGRVTVEEKRKNHSYLMWAVFGILSAFWVFRDSVGVVMGIRDILPVRLLSPLPFMIISTIAVAVTAGLLYFMELQFFRMAMEVESIDLDSAKLQADREKMESVRKMNSALMEKSRPDLSYEQFAVVAELASLLNEDAKKEKLKYTQEYPETRGQTLTWSAVQVLGIAVGLFSDYFTYHSILVFLAPALVSTPVGIGLLTGAMLVSLCIYGSLYRKSFIRSLVPHFNEYEENQKIAEAFSYRSEQEVTRAYDKECVYGAVESTQKIKKVVSAPDLRDLHTKKVKITVFRSPFLKPLTAGGLQRRAVPARDHETGRESEAGFQYGMH